MSYEHDPELRWQLRRLRMETAGMRSSPESRERLMARFDETQARKPRMTWGPLAIAATVILSLAMWGRLVSLPSSNQGAPTDPVVAEETAEANDGFIAVPFVPPLAQGESVHIVHMELHPAALAGLGVNVDPAWATSMPADLLVGEDGFPRAVRVSNEDSGGF